jgi:hypothetical protein
MLFVTTFDPFAPKARSSSNNSEVAPEEENLKQNSQKLIVVAAICAFSTPAVAITRLYAGNLSCKAILSAIDKEGEAIVRYSSKRIPSLLLYNKYVSERAGCFSDEQTVTGLIPAKDMECQLTYCVRYENSN